MFCPMIRRKFLLSKSRGLVYSSALLVRGTKTFCDRLTGFLGGSETYIFYSQVFFSYQVSVILKNLYMNTAKIRLGVKIWSFSTCIYLTGSKSAVIPFRLGFCYIMLLLLFAPSPLAFQYNGRLVLRSFPINELTSRLLK